MRTVTCLLVTGMFTFFITAISHSSEEKNLLPQIDTWINQLGHEDYSKRKEAKKHILDMSPPILPTYEYLQKKAEKTTDPEIQSSLKKILKELQLPYEAEKMSQFCNPVKTDLNTLPFLKNHLSHLKKIQDPQKREIGRAALLSYLIPYLPSFKEKETVFTTWLEETIFFLSQDGKTLLSIPRKQFIQGVLGNANAKKLQARNLNILKLSIYSLKEALANKIYGCDFVVQKSRLPLGGIYLAKIESNFTDSLGGADYFLFRKVGDNYKIVANWEEDWIDKGITLMMDKRRWVLEIEKMREVAKRFEEKRNAAADRGRDMAGAGRMLRGMQVMSSEVKKIDKPIIQNPPTDSDFQEKNGKKSDEKE